MITLKGLLVGVGLISAPEPSDCIVFGKVVNIPKPWLGAIIKNREHYGAGVLINDRYGYSLITAAHIGDASPSDFSVITGITDFGNNDPILQTSGHFKVNEIFNHPQYSEHAIFGYDVAVWKLSFVEGTHKPNLQDFSIKLDDGSYIKDGREASVAGWGAFSRFGILNGLESFCGKILRETKINIWDPESVSSKLFQNGYFFKFHDSILAAGGFDTKKKGVDRGDSGGPLYVSQDEKEIVVLGITSFRTEKEDFPQAFAKISDPSIAKFIGRHVSKMCYQYLTQSRQVKQTTRKEKNYKNFKKSMWKSMLIALGLLSSPEPSECILWGRPVKVAKPWMANVLLRGYQYGGGALFKDNDGYSLLTVAHISTQPLKDYFILSEVQNTGDKEQFGGAVKFTVDRIINHPGYMSPRRGRDIAIWKLKLVPGSKPPNIDADSLVLDNGSYSEYSTDAKVAGWGVYTRFKFLSSIENECGNILRETKIKIRSQETVEAFLEESKLPSYESLYPQGVMAGGGIDTGNRGASFGDSGSPLFVESSQQDVLVGLSSFGYSPTWDSELPQAFSKVSDASITEFIKEHLKVSFGTHLSGEVSEKDGTIDRADNSERAIYSPTSAKFNRLNWW